MRKLLRWRVNERGRGGDHGNQYTSGKDDTVAGLPKIEDDVLKARKAKERQSTLNKPGASSNLDEAEKGRTDEKVAEAVGVVV